MNEAGHQWGVVLAMLAGQPLPATPPATSTSHTHHADGFSPEAEKRITHLFGKDPDDMKTPRKSRT